MRLACIDIGTNTTRLLVVERTEEGLREVAAAKAFTRLGHGMQGERIAAERLAGLRAALLAQRDQCRELGVERVRAVATAVARRAANREDLAAAVHEAGGLTLDILTGEEEARLAFLGATCPLEETLACRPEWFPTGRGEGLIAVVDVGGGSTEIATGPSGGEPGWVRSLEIGSLRLTEGFLHQDPPTAAELAAARRAVAATFAGLAPPAVATVLAVGGSATSLARLAGPVLDGAALGRALEVLRAGPSQRMATELDLDARRARLLPAGILILQEVAALLRRDPVAGCGGLREGILREMLRDASG